MGSFGLGHERFNLIIPHISFPQAHIHGIFYAKFVDAWGTTKNGGFIKIPMPEADVQKDLIRKYNTQLAEAKKDQDSIDNLQYQIEQYILKKLGISFKRSSFNGLIGTT